MSLEIEDIESILIIVQFKDGNAHQVLTSKENKEVAIHMIAAADGRLALDKELAPMILKHK
jgi:hypothetical protein